MFDFHLHLARLPEPATLAELLYEKKYGFTAIACEPWEWKSIAELKKSHEGSPAFRFQAAYGIHPMIASQVSWKIAAENGNSPKSPGASAVDGNVLVSLRKYLLEDATAQVGEAGLDRRFEGYEPGGIQEQVFLAQARMAKELGRDLQIHCVGDYGRIIALLKKAGFEGRNTNEESHAAGNESQAANNESQAAGNESRGPRPVFHRFGGDVSIIKAGLSMGAIFSLHRDSFRKRSTTAAITLIPPENIRFETDADESFLVRKAGPASASPATPEECCNALVEQLKDIQEKMKTVQG